MGNKSPLGDKRSLNWEIAKLKCEEKWGDLFPEHQPKKGKKVNDFIRENTLLV